MRVLVTGHRGYIGAELCPLLGEAGFDVVGLDTGFFDDRDFRAPPADVPALDLDLRDVAPDHLRGVGAVVHLGALCNDPVRALDPRLTYDINLHGSVSLARSARAAGVGRFVFASSCSLYGAGPDGYLTEDATFQPVTPYGESKVEAEREIGRLADARFAPVYLRNATAYGVSRRLRADLMVNQLVGCALTTGKIAITGDGSPWRPLVHLRDICRGVIAALTAPADAVRNQAFNIGRTQENFRLREVAELIAQVAPRCEVGFAPGASADARNYRVDFTKAEQSLPGFSPGWTLRAGIEELCAAYREHGLTEAELAGPRYHRIRTLRGRLERGELDQDLRWVEP